MDFYPISSGELPPIFLDTRSKCWIMFVLTPFLDTLPDEEQRALILVIDSFVKKSQVEKVVGKRSAKR